MCTNKLSIKNKGYNEKYPFSHPFVSVPCGHCVECRDQINNEYAFRCSMQTDNVLKHGGQAYFVTLTYDNQHLPFIRFMSHGEEKVCSTWNKFHLQKLIKDLRNHILRDFGGGELSYLVVTERGKSSSYVDYKGKLRFCTKRPHYHAIFWLTPSHKTTKFQGTTECWNKHYKHAQGVTLFECFPCLLASLWPYGHIDNELLTRSPQSATKYITKYMGKQDKDYTNYIPLDSIIFHNCQRDTYGSLPFGSTQFRPFKLISKGIGSAFAPNSDQYCGITRVAFDGREFTLPRYYQKRAFNKLDQTFARPADIVSTKEKWTYTDGYTPADKYRQVFVPKYGYCRNGDISQPISDDKLVYSTKTIVTEFGEECKTERYVQQLSRLSQSVYDFVHNFNMYIPYVRDLNDCLPLPNFKETFSHPPDTSVWDFESEVKFKSYLVRDIIDTLFDVSVESFNVLLHDYFYTGVPESSEFLVLFEMYQSCLDCRMALNTFKNNNIYHSKKYEMLFKKPELFARKYEQEQLPSLECEEVCSKRHESHEDSSRRDC